MRYTYTFLPKSICRLFSCCRFLCAFTLSKCFRNKCKKYFTYRSFYQLAKVFFGRRSIKTLKVRLSAISIKTEFCGRYFPVNFSETFKRLFYRKPVNRCFLTWLIKLFFICLKDFQRNWKACSRMCHINMVILTVFICNIKMSIHSKFHISDLHINLLCTPLILKLSFQIQPHFWLV